MDLSGMWAEQTKRNSIVDDLVYQGYSSWAGIGAWILDEETGQIEFEIDPELESKVASKREEILKKKNSLRRLKRGVHDERDD